MDYNRKPNLAGEGINDIDADASGEPEGRQAVPVIEREPKPTKAPAASRKPRTDLLQEQLNRVAHEPNMCGEAAATLRKATLDTYDSLTPRSGLESMVARNLIGLNNLSMRLMGQAGLNPRHEELRLKYVPKIAGTFAEFASLYQKLRDNREKREMTAAKSPDTKSRKPHGESEG